MASANSGARTCQLTKAEVQLYDRQIRLWGLEAQRKLRNAKILLVGLTPSMNEVAKNIILAGVGRVTLVDTRIVEEKDVQEHFYLENADVGKSLADVLARKLSELNPRTKVISLNVKAEELTSEFFGEHNGRNFDHVCLSCTGKSLKSLIDINEKCRLMEIQLSIMDTRGSFGVIFFDLLNIRTESNTVEYCPLATALTENYHDSFPVPLTAKSLKSLARKVSPLCLLFQLSWLQPDNKSLSADPLIFLERRGLPCSFIPRQLYNEFFDQEGLVPFPPVSAIVGGVLAQDMIRALTSQYLPLPLKNFFVYDGIRDTGLVHDLGRTSCSRN